MPKIEGVMLVLLVVLVCCTHNATDQSPAAHTSRTNPNEALQGRQGEETTIRKVAGIVVLNNRYSKNDFVHIYNQDGSLWYEFSFYNNESATSPNKDFKPFAYHPDYFLLALKCVGKSEHRFEVVVNEETGLKKYVQADDQSLKFETWEEHIPKVFAVDFNRTDNPVLETPEGRVKSIDFPKGVTFHPVEVKGEWLKIRWADTERTANKKTQADFGWVRWKRDEAILIELFYFS